MCVCVCACLFLPIGVQHPRTTPKMAGGRVYVKTSRLDRRLSQATGECLRSRLVHVPYNPYGKMSPYLHGNPGDTRLGQGGRGECFKLETHASSLEHAQGKRHIGRMGMGKGVLPL